MFFMVKKAKQRLLLENCKYFLKKEKIVLRVYICWGSPLPTGYGPDFITVNFDQW